MSFIKAAKEKQHSISGTRSSIFSTQLLLTSSGTPSLDQLLGGGLPCGSLFIIEEDAYAEYSRVLLKYFLAEGIVCKHSVFLASLESNGNDLASRLPQPTVSDSDITPDIEGADQSLRIAWRYEKLEPVDPTIKPNSQFGHYFDLTKHLDEEVISKSDINIWRHTDVEDCCDRAAFENPAIADLLRSILKKLKNDVFNPTHHSAESNILRIGIESFGSPFWTPQEIGASHLSEGKDLIKFVYCLRMLLRSTYGVAFLTVPSHLFEDSESSVMKRLQHSADFVLKLESFAGSDKETNPLFKDYHGLVQVQKMAAFNVLPPHIPSALDLAFKLRRKKFIIEKLHLPPELQDSTEREQDDISSVSCSGPNKKKIDF